jgi:AcrR family transcriptional regulator
MTPSAGVSEDLKDQGRSVQKRRPILDAATEVFLQKRYLATNMDEIVALAAVSKQTVYKNFPSKETLFVEIVSSVTNRAADRVYSKMPNLAEGEICRISSALCVPTTYRCAHAVRHAGAPPGDRRGRPFPRTGEGAV